jgi:hypothetical protein
MGNSDHGTIYTRHGPTVESQEGGVSPTASASLSVRQTPGVNPQGSGFRGQGSGLRVHGSGLRVQGPGFAFCRSCAVRWRPRCADPPQSPGIKPLRYRAVEPSSGSNVIPRRARPGLSGLRPHTWKGLPNVHSPCMTAVFKCQTRRMCHAWAIKVH